MLDSIGKSDVSDVMKVILEKAKAGDVKAAALFFSLLGAKS
jgi:hypothetical protein